MTRRMVIPRTVRYLVMGVLAGAVVAFLVWRSAQADLAAGEDAAGVGFGTSHVLFFLSLPWSLAIFIIGPILSAFDVHKLYAFYVLPVIAGVGWAWLLSERQPTPRRRPSRRAP